MVPIIKRTSLGVAMAPLYKTAIAMVTALQKRFAASLFASVASNCDADALTEQFSTRMNSRSSDNDTVANNQEDVSNDVQFIHNNINFKLTVFIYTV